MRSFTEDVCTKLLTTAAARFSESVFSRNSQQWKCATQPSPPNSDQIGVASSSSSPGGGEGGWRPQHGGQNARAGRGLDSEQAVELMKSPSIQTIFALIRSRASTGPETPATSQARPRLGWLRSLESGHTFNPSRARSSHTAGTRVCVSDCRTVEHSPWRLPLWPLRLRVVKSAWPPSFSRPGSGGVESLQ
jgi:hypothetical protein